MGEGENERVLREIDEKSETNLSVTIYTQTIDKESKLSKMYYDSAHNL